MRVLRVVMSRIYAIYAKLTPNDAESCAERNQSHIFVLTQAAFHEAAYLFDRQIGEVVL